MIGNDVVDLRDPEAAPGARHPRFDARVFAASEVRAIEESATPDRLRWSLWAAKEAAFKAARKRHGGLRFSPIRFVTELEGAGGRVRHGGLVLQVRLDVSDERVHALAAYGCDPRRVGFRVAEMRTDPSGDARHLALRTLSPALGVPRSRLSIVRRAGVPRLLAGGELVSVDLSLSHHGRFVAFAWSVEGARATGRAA